MPQIQAVRAEERYNINQRGKQKAKSPFETPVPFPFDRSVSDIPVFLYLPTQSQCPVPSIYYKKTKKINATPPSSIAVTTPGGASLIAPATTMGWATVPGAPGVGVTTPAEPVLVPFFEHPPQDDGMG
jgi:hypothetical protein